MSISSADNIVGFQIGMNDIEQGNAVDDAFELFLNTPLLLLAQRIIQNQFVQRGSINVLQDDTISSDSFIITTGDSAEESGYNVALKVPEPFVGLNFARLQFRILQAALLEDEKRHRETAIVGKWCAQEDWPSRICFVD